MSRVRRLDNVKRPSSCEDWHTETKQQTATHKLAYGAATRLCSGLNNDTGTGDSTTDHHSVPATPGIASRSDKGKSGDTTNLVHGRDDTSPSTGTLDSVVCFESIVGEKRIEHGAIETVGGGAHETDQGTYVKDERVPGEKSDGFLKLSLCECFRARDDLDLGNGALEVLEGCQFDAWVRAEDTYAIVRVGLMNDLVRGCIVVSHCSGVT